MEGEKKKKVRWLTNVVFVLALGVFVFSAYKLIIIYSEYRKGDTEYEKILDDVVKVETETEDEQEVKNPDGHTSLMIDFAQLQNINPDTVGWIQFTEPEKISYPIVKGTDNDRYLTTTFEGKGNSSGAIFMDANNSGAFTDRNTFIYGHNMKNGSMFGQLRRYKAKDFWEKYPYFYIYTPDGGEVKYQIFSVCIVEDTSESYVRHYQGDEEYMDYLNYIKNIALYDTGIQLDETSQIISLSTCTNVTETQRLLVHGVKTSE